MKHLFIDIDGVLVPLRGPDGRLTINDWNVSGLFNRHDPIMYNIKAITELLPMSEYTYHILSAVPTLHAIQEKEQWLDKYFNCKSRHYIEYLKQTKGELIYLQYILKGIAPTDCLLIDDELHNLINVETYGISAMHISYLQQMYEKRNEDVKGNDMESSKTIRRGKRKR